MKRVILLISLFFIVSLLNSCFKTTTKTGAISEENRMNLSTLAINMTQQQVLDTMGYPYKTQEEISQNKIYEVWYYITEPTLLGQSRLVTRNFTPVVFESGHLVGWGRNFYKYTFDVDEERKKREEEKRQAYTNDKEEWPQNEHKYIPPLNAKKSDTSKTAPSTQSPTASQASSKIGSTATKDSSKNGENKSDMSSSSAEINVTQPKPQNSQPQSGFQEKPPCCLKKAQKTNACDKCKTKTDVTKSQSKSTETKRVKPVKSTTKKDKNVSAPCKDKEDRAEGYNFWE